MIRTTHTHTTRHGRRGVTLVEMLVATAMCILGMWMLTWMFQQATASFSLATAQAALTSQERMVTTIMTRDLEADRFLEDDTQPNRGRKLSDYKGTTAPKAGYLMARSSPPGKGGNPISEGSDSNTFQSSRSVNHILQFTSILPDTPNNQFLAHVPASSGTTYAGRAAEIVYFLKETGSAPNSPSVKLYDLMRVQRIVATTDQEAKYYLDNVVTPNFADAVEVIACSTGKMHTLRDLAQPGSLRFGTAPAVYEPRPTTSGRYGEDRLLSNVLSFEVKFTGLKFNGVNSDGTNPNPDLSWPAPFSSNSDYPYDNLPDTAYTFDSVTNFSQTNTQRLRITGVQIRIRALSGTTARQTTIVIAL